MKRCPECRRDYYDDSLLYCLEDGVPLVQGPVAVDEPPTAVFARPGGESEVPSSGGEFRVPPSGGSADETKTQLYKSRQTNETPQSAISDPQSGKAGAPAAFDRRVLLAPVALAMILVGGFVAYRYLGSANANRIESIAVMPFANESGNAEFEYLSDGMTETLINSLSQNPDLSVKGRSSVFRFKGKGIEPQQVATELGVKAVLNGRVLQRGDSITLSLDLTDGSTGNQIWGEQYVRKLTDLVALQKEIAQDVSDKLKARLTSAQQQQLETRHSVNPEAYQFYLQGRYQWNKRTDEGVIKAEQLFQKAIERDPQYALAYVGLADSYIVVDLHPPNEAKPKAKAAALKALQLDSTLGEAHAVLANVAFFYEWDWPTAEREYKRAIELSPNYPTTYHWYGETLASLGRFEESAAQFERARVLDPISLAIATDHGMMYFYAREYDRGIEHFKRVIETDPTFVRSHHYLATIYEEKGMFPEAIEARKRAELIGEVNVEEVAADFKQVSDAYRRSGPRAIGRLFYGSC